MRPTMPTSPAKGCQHRAAETVRARGLDCLKSPFKLLASPLSSTKEDQPVQQIGTVASRAAVPGPLQATLPPLGELSFLKTLHGVGNAVGQIVPLLRSERITEKQMKIRLQVAQHPLGLRLGTAYLCRLAGSTPASLLARGKLLSSSGLLVATSSRTSAARKNCSPTKRQSRGKRRYTRRSMIEFGSRLLVV